MKREVIGLPKKTALLLREWRLKSTEGWRRGLALLLAAVVVAASPGIAGAGERLDAATLAKVFRGVSVLGFYRDGSVFTETYREDGSIRYFDNSGTAGGTWSIKDGKFCTIYKEIEGSCFVVEREGANCFTFFAPDPQTNKIDREGWSARVWNPQNGKRTCPSLEGEGA
jgi:hypothetical protein